MKSTNAEHTDEREAKLAKAKGEQKKQEAERTGNRDSEKQGRDRKILGEAHEKAAKQ